MKDIFVPASVSGDELSYDVRVANAGEKSVSVELSASLSSWNKAEWHYPSLPACRAVVPAKGEATMTVKGIRWGLGPESYWWPNIPFREAYAAQLHVLTLSLKQDGLPLHTTSRRFGFVQHAEGAYYYTVNGVRVNGFSDATAEPQLSEFDGYAMLPAYRTANACRETWRRFMQIGINTNRTHQSTPTELMMDTADEVGFMLVPETGIRGFHNQGWHPIYLPQAVREMVIHARNHPSTVRYSLQNEMAFDKDHWTALIDAAAESGPTRPLVIEDTVYKDGAR